MEKVLSDKIRNANVLLTLFIVMLHSTWKEAQALSPMNNITDCAVPAFFCMSSFLYFRNWQPTRSFYVSKLRSRFKSLLIPFISYSIIFTAWKAFTAHFTGTEHANSIPTDITGMFEYIIMCKSDGPLWYIRELMIFVVCAPIIGRIISISSKSIFVFFACSLIFHTAPYDCIIFWLPCIALGCHCTIWHKEMKGFINIVRNMNKWIFFGLYATIILAVCMLADSMEERAMLPYYLYRMTAPLLLIGLYARCTMLPSWLVSKIAPYTFFIYCTHFIVVGTLREVLTSRIELCNPFAIWVSTAVTGTALCLFAAYISKKITPLWRLLNGFRA